jgi:hypothetical protein
MNNSSSYKHVQHTPGLLLQLMYVIGLFVVLGRVLIGEQPIPWFSPPILLFILIFAGSFHHLTVEDKRERLSVSFGPIPLFRRTIRYDDIVGVEIGRTTILDGWGIHWSLRGGWVWNIWGRDCVVLQLRKGILRVGTDDAENLAAFVRGRIGERRASDD